MSAAQSSHSSITYLPRTLQRAEQAVRCAPFRPLLYEAMGQEGVSLKAIAGSAGVNHQFTRRAISELAVENDLLWLIQVGVLRREVDGQGLTDSFRLTPLGRALLRQWERDGFPRPPSWLMRLRNFILRWVPIPGIQ
ncbi:MULTISPECIES: Npun_F0494 family protein [unclassified Leptolyngbya]|uniref:Npun_F0494 family protein n=1 Tax=unclassified Leptolyngbya TaxID=2650499 RepID=UPI001684FEEF|nr:MULTISPECIES: Npun_F0494 family protein [unclassified Leptolyngbya]MBD1914171.1 hypothetical protein [Leptolyngbya sp. FACHB-8]MBD2157178.1 hypothetical protein [Leptolyngbya sp. FACHB-16]